MLAHYILDENSKHGLKEIAKEVFGIADYEKQLISQYLSTRNDSYSKIPFDKLSQYAAWDVVVTRALAIKFEQDLKNDNMYEWPFMNVIMPANEMFVDVEFRGIQTDMSYLPRAAEAMDKELKLLEQEASSMYKEGINLNSPQQVCALLYDDLKIPVPRIEGVPWRSSARAAVNSLVGKHPFVDLLVYYRRIGKLKGSYIENMLDYVDVEGKLHPTFWLHGTEMGRLSARNPAIQTIPRPGEKWIDTVGTRSGPLTDGALIRGSIRASPGNLLVISDYSQAELRTVACLAHEPFLMDVYMHDRDLHTEVAIAMYGDHYKKEERQRCKMFNFSYIYGGNEFSFAKDAGLDINVARKFVQDYNRVMPRLAKYRVEQYNLMLSQGYVTTIFNRRRRFVLITDRNKDDVRKAAVHAPVAGTASDLTLLSAIRVWKAGVPVVLTVHDSILADVEERIAPEVGEFVETTMRDVGSEYLPEVPWKSDTEIVTHWSEAPVL
jgi:DNA polymerase-1